MTLPAGVYVRGAPAAGGDLAVMKVHSNFQSYILHCRTLANDFKQI